MLLMLIPLRVGLLAVTTLYQGIACWMEDRQPPPGQLFDVGGYRLHLYTQGEAKPTFVLEHSLGGVEGYLLIEELAKLGKVCIYDRAGYGWSDHSPRPRTSAQIVQELDILLTQANIEPPYILIGDSFGSYNVRLYTATFPEKVMGMVLTDGLHEVGMLKMPLSLKALKFFFISGFLMSVFGTCLGIVRLLNLLGIFEFLKPELRKFSRCKTRLVKRSFLRPKHWITMTRELLNIDVSARQIAARPSLCNIPIVSIKAKSFFKPSLWTLFIPLSSANKLREQMHRELLKLSDTCVQLPADQSSHFVWVDQPDLLVESCKIILEKIHCSDQNSPSL
jgi:pimeloyl-ACP methyl ester carboxylesterase